MAYCKIGRRQPGESFQAYQVRQRADSRDRAIKAPVRSRTLGKRYKLDEPDPIDEKDNLGISPDY